jgi:hypothetical protein
LSLQRVTVGKKAIVQQQFTKKMKLLNFLCDNQFTGYLSRQVAGHKIRPGLRQHGQISNGGIGNGVRVTLRGDHGEQAAHMRALLHFVLDVLQAFISEGGCTNTACKHIGSRYNTFGVKREKTLG